jgi:hypothetical protein
MRIERVSPAGAVLAAVLAMSAGPGCDTGFKDLPAVARPLDYPTVHVDLPGCEVRLPPVHDLPRCSPDDVGARIDAGEVCRLLVGLKEQVERGRMSREGVGAADWQFARSSCVSRRASVPPPHHSRPLNSPDDEQMILTLYVELPERSRILFAQMSEHPGTIDYFVSPR